MQSSPVRTVSILFSSLFLLHFSAPYAHAQPLRCTGVIDGNTILLSNREKVHLIGVVAPEPKDPKKPADYYGRESFAFTRKMVEGKPVRLEYDLQQRDKHGMLLAYVYLLDGTFLNAEIIKQGYGHAYTQFPFKYLDQFRQYEKEAGKAKRGLWADEVPHEARKLIQEQYVGSKQLKHYHLPHCTIAQKLTPADSRQFISVKEAVDAGYAPCKICKPPYHK